MKKPNVTSHYAWHGADSGRWGGAYYSDRGSRCRDTWQLSDAASLATAHMLSGNQGAGAAAFSSLERQEA
jgi:hypothetical protein